MTIGKKMLDNHRLYEAKWRQLKRLTSGGDPYA